jgi:hypothetical protein
MRDYGNRVGVLRLGEVLDRYEIRATAALNSDVCLHHPEIIEEGEKRQWEWMGHNQSNSRRLVLCLKRSVLLMVPRGGIEPPTPAFSVQCSTN